MKTVKNIIHQNIISWLILAVIIVLMFSTRISAQQKFTIQLADGEIFQLPVDDLVLTFNNYGSFSIWQKGLLGSMNFTSVGLIYFTDQPLPTMINEKNSVFEGLKVYPNPTKGIITLEFNQNSVNKKEISVLNVIGVEVLRKELINADKLQVDLSNQVNGIYFLKVIIDNQQYINKVVIRKQ